MRTANNPLAPNNMTTKTFRKYERAMKYAETLKRKGARSVQIVTVGLLTTRPIIEVTPC